MTLQNLPLLHNLCQDAPVKPSAIRMVPELNIAALNQNKDKELLFWYLLRSLDSTGCGHVLFADVEREFTTTFKYSHRTFHRHLRLGESKLWSLYHNRRTTIRIYALKKAFEYLNTFNASRFISLDLAMLNKHRRALLWNTGAYRPFGTGRHNHPISRASLQEVTKIPERNQQRYDATIETMKSSTLVKSYDPITHKRFNQHIIVSRRRGTTDMAIKRSLGNIYTSHALRHHKGMVNRSVKQAKDGRGSFVAGEAPHKNLMPGRRFYDSFKDWCKLYFKGKARPEDIYYSSKNNDSVYIEVEHVS